MTHLNEELLDAAADGAAVDAVATEHLGACAECRAQVQRLQILRAQLAELPHEVATTVDVWPRVRATIRTRQTRRRMTFASIALPLAAAIVFAVVHVPTPPDDAPAISAVSPTNELAELRAIVPPDVADAMAANLAVYDTALKELEAHAAFERENTDVRQRIDELRRKRAALLRLASNS
jgi:hypothetical protein